MTALVADIISKVKRLITLPEDDTLYQTSDFLAYINDCLIEKVYPRLMKIRDDYCLVREVFNLQNSQGIDLYPTGVMPIPSRAWGNTLREIKYIDVSGNYYKVNPYYLEDIDLYQYRNLAFSSTYQKGFIPFNSGIKLIPPPMQDLGSIEMHYIVTPSILISSSQVSNAYGQITNMQFDSTTNYAIYVVNKLINNGVMDMFCPEGSTGVFDIYNAQTGMLLAVNVILGRLPDVADTSLFTGVCTVQNGTNIISPNITELTNFQFGGYPVVPPTYTPSLYLVPAGTNNFTPLPPPLDNLLIYEVALKILSAQGDLEQLQVISAEHVEMRKDILSQMALRVECEPPVISNKRGIRASILYNLTRNRRYYR